MRPRVLTGVVLLAFGTLFAAPTVRAAYTVTFSQVGSNVVASGSGTVDIRGFGPGEPFTSLAEVQPVGAAEMTGANDVAVEFLGAEMLGPSSFGPGGLTLATTGTGDPVGIDRSLPGIAVPVGYVSGAPLSDSATYSGASLATLGLRV